MKVVHVESGRHLYGGARQVLYLCQGLIDQGIGSTIVCEPGSDVDLAARRQGIPVHNLHCAGDLDVRYWFRLKSYFAAAAPDIVHSHSRRGADIYSGRAAASLGIPAVVSRRVDHNESPLSSALRYSAYRRVIAISRNIAEVLHTSGVSADRLVTIRSAVDVAELAAECNVEHWRTSFSLDQSNIVGAIVAQLIPRKGHRFVFDVLPELCGRFPNFRLLVFGQGPLKQDLNERVAKLGLSDKVFFAGFRPDLAAYLQCIDLLIHPALQEGLGVAMLNASAAAVPVIAFDVAGAREVVADGETGILVPPQDRTALLRAITQLVENPGQRRSMGQAGQIRMKNEFSVDAMVARHIELYRSVLDEQ